MYLSHPVRRLRDDPGDGDVSLVVEVDGDEEFRDVVVDAGGSVEEELGFDCWLVTVPETTVTDLCEVDAVTRIETAATLDLGVDDDSTKTGGP